MFPSSAELFASDLQLKNVNKDKYLVKASEASLSKTVDALQAKKVKVTIVDTAPEALKVLTAEGGAIPSGATVSNGGSTTLHQIGWTSHLQNVKNADRHFHNMGEEIFAEKDMLKQTELRRKGLAADVFVSGVDAITEDGDILAVDATGTRVGGWLACKTLVLVTSTHKIVPTYADAVKRVEEYSVPVESARVRVAYKLPASSANNWLALRGANPFAPFARVHVIFIKDEVLGF
ncbi:hypothetical protein SeMB42_g05453 [Synchytrium endobioticum]|uniref:LUD domain-containing protein n=1 Tax=Synchytrium endobioticum TaxID=286115 RepID=A0A507CRI4_9FUNG|nr:hypothetical protein SeMB42_g05453 [Synchytrium endobioticum]TPX45660.1 hypothetical protein SeLEV6574_g03744 [Synchytrium endobioticum]